MKRIAAAVAVIFGLISAPGTTRAQDYPTRTVTVIVPFAGGSASDVIMRVLLEKMGTTMGRRFIVENRPGAGGNTGTLAASKADPDGYTLVMSSVGPLSSNRHLVRELGYDPEKDLAPIGLFAHIPNIVVASAKLPVKTLPELIAYAKERPKQLNYGSVGVGSSQHVAGVFFEQLTGTEMTHVPYRNIAQYGPDLIAGIVPLGFQFFPNVAAQVRSGDARALAVASKTRLAALPDVPTSAEAGLPAYESSGWLALLAPPGTPKPIIERLNKELKNAIADETVRARFAELGAQPNPGTPEELSQLIVSEAKKWGDIIKRAGISIEQQ
jgi:tripartite-type tricarboxylate transporter receptor subunit TctC